MDKKTASIAKAFYTALGEKNIQEVENFLHEDIEFKAPLATAKGKESYREVLKGFMAAFKTLTIDCHFGGDDQAMVVYDVEFPSIGNVRSASLLTFQKNLISKIELIYDARPFNIPASS